ncbi:hypothetical protein [Micromonospora sp. NPDC092111]|uniref:hypothetical protein n=1 Tax=Micromonospora sp. NPDC092111 TaxID=3364289 RepID=UPI0038112604
MEFLLAFVVTGLAAGGGWLVWGAGRQWTRYRRRRHELLVARTYAEGEIRRAEIAAELREQELANQIYQDFSRRHPPSP